MSGRGQQKMINQLGVRKRCEVCPFLQWSVCMGMEVQSTYLFHGQISDSNQILSASHDLSAGHDRLLQPLTRRT